MTTAIVIEDEPDLCIIFRTALQAAGFDEAKVIDDGMAAMTYLDNYIPDLILLDLHLPNVSGAEILHRIRSDERLENIPVIVATADPQMAEELRDDSDLELLKPISFTQLRDLASRLLQRRK